MKMKKNLMMILAAVATSAILPFSAWAVDPVTIKDADGADISVYEVSPGFYQGALKYADTTDFYITSKAGLKFFRDMVSARDGGVAITTYVNGGFYPSQNVPGIYTNSMFNNKTVHLLCDIDLENEDWTPIGYVNQGYNNGQSRTYFYGSFDGHNHVISNLKVVADSSNQSNTQAGNEWKNYGSYGLFGYVSSNTNPTFRNLTIHNFEGVVGETVTSDPSVGAGDYVGAIVGNAGSNPVTFNNCKVTGLVKISGGYSGAICGIGNANVVNCEVRGDDGSTISGNSFAGALVGAERCGSAGTTITGNNVSGVDVTSSQFAGGLVGAMATGASGACSITENNLSDVIVNDAAVTEETLIASNSAATTPITEVDNTIVAPPQPVTNSVQSANLFGAVKITGNVASNMYVAVPFEGFESAGAARKAKDVVHPANLTAETKMYVYDKANDSHDVYKVTSGAWAPAVKVTINSNNAATLDAASLDRAVPAGTGVLVARANAGDNVYVYGQIPASAAAVTFAQGQTFVAPPYTNATVDVSGVKYINLNTFTWTGVSAAKQDRKLISGADFIQFRDANNRLIKYYHDGTSWGLQPTYAKLASYKPYVEGGKALVPQGTAFWYCSSVGGAKVEWK